MQTLALEIAITFVDDAAALVTGTGRIIIQLLTSPSERLAATCDVAGVLPRAKPKRAASTASHERLGPISAKCLFPLVSRSDLT